MNRVNHSNEPTENYHLAGVHACYLWLYSDFQLALVGLHSLLSSALISAAEHWGLKLQKTKLAVEVKFKSGWRAKQTCVNMSNHLSAHFFHHRVCSLKDDVSEVCSCTQEFQTSVILTLALCKSGISTHLGWSTLKCIHMHLECPLVLFATLYAN